MNEFTIRKTKYSIINFCSGEFDIDIPGHTHSKNSYEIHLVYSGHGTLITKENTYDLNKNMVYVTGGDLWHEQLFDRKNPLSEHCLYIYVEKGCDLLSDIFTEKKFYISKANKDLRNHFNELYNNAMNRTIINEEKIKNIAPLIILDMISLYSSIDILAIPQCIDERKWLIIENSFLYDYKDLTLEMLSKKVNMTPRSLERLLNSYYNMSFTKIRTKARMEASIKFLNDKTPVNETAILVGYKDSSSFINAFKKYYNSSPKRYE